MNNPFNRFVLLLSDHRVVIDWLQKEHLLASDVRCERCDSACTMSARKKSIDGFVWRCPARDEVIRIQFTCRF